MRIVSGTLATDEALLDLVDPSRLAALTVFADDPRVSNATRAARAVRVRIRPGDPERVLSLEPDLVLLAGFTRQEDVDLLEASGAPVRRLKAYETLEDIRGNLRWLGRLVGEPERAEALVARMDAEISAVRRAVAGRPPSRILSYSPDGYTPGRHTLFDELVGLAGGVNLAAEAGIEGHATMSLEEALQLDPDVIVLCGYDGDPGTKEIAPAVPLSEDPVWRASRAVRTGRVHVLGATRLTCLSHHIARAVEDLARRMHPGVLP